MSFWTVIALIAAFVLYMKSKNGRCKAKQRLDGRTCLVNGGTSGIGLHVALDFAKRGARVIITGPFKDEGINAQKTIVEQTGNHNIAYKFVDLMSLESTRKFTDEILKSEDRLDILMNNAGIGESVYKLTADNLSSTMQVNYYGHFLVTILLLPLLKKSGTPAAKSRIVNTSSSLHKSGKINIGKMNVIDNSANRVSHYSNSKLCLILFARELTRRLKGSNVVINSVDPGQVATGLFFKRYGYLLGSLITTYCFIFQQTPFDGAQRCLHVALDPNVGDVSGEYFDNCRIARAIKVAYDDDTARKLWDESVELVKLNNDEIDKCLI